MKELRTVFLGTPDFSVPTLKSLYQNPNIDLIHVISMPDRPAGRGQNLKSPPVIEFAKQNNIVFSQTENINKDQKLLTILQDMEIDIIIVLAFAQFLGTKILEMPRIAPFNIHTSLLPKYRGAAPIQYALLNGDNKTGVSIQRMVKKMDAGDLVHSVSVDIQPNETGGELWSKLQDLAAEACTQFIDKVVHDEIEYLPQNEEDVSFAPTIEKKDGLIDFNQLTFKEIQNKIRAFDPWPGTYFFLDNKRVKLFAIEKCSIELEPGESKIIEANLCVGTKSDSLKIAEIQFEGKSRSSFRDFLNGYRGEMKLGKK